MAHSEFREIEVSGHALLVWEEMQLKRILVKNVTWVDYDEDHHLQKSNKQRTMQEKGGEINALKMLASWICISFLSTMFNHIANSIDIQDLHAETSEMFNQYVIF